MGRFPPLLLTLVASFGQSGAIDVPTLVAEAAETIRIAQYATLSTFGTDGSIKSRVVWPKPPNASLSESPDLHFLSFATKNGTRKVHEILANPRATLIYYDEAGGGEVSIMGTMRVCDRAEGTEGFWDVWEPFYEGGPACPDYVLLRLEASDLEFVSYDRFHVDEGTGRPDWRPLTLHRSPTAQWEYVPPPETSPVVLKMI